MAKQGNIGVTSENIFPIIKKFLYSDHEIFLRELVSNAVDATQKLKTLASVGEFKGELGDLTVHVSFDSNTIKISDRGIGMTAEEIDKYINQIAFSGAEEFVEKYKNDAAAIIGHFGLGFYSSFMVSKKVEIGKRRSRNRHHPVYRRREQRFPEQRQDQQPVDQVLPLPASSHRIRKEAGMERRQICRYRRRQYHQRYPTGMGS